MTSDSSKNDARKVEIAEIASIMRTRSGRNVLARFLLMSNYRANTFDRDPIQHAYNAGRRAVGLAIEAELKAAAPGEYNTLLREMDE